MKADGNGGTVERNMHGSRKSSAWRNLVDLLMKFVRKNYAVILQEQSVAW